MRVRHPAKTQRSSKQLHRSSAVKATRRFGRGLVGVVVVSYPARACSSAIRISNTASRAYAWRMRPGSVSTRFGDALLRATSAGNAAEVVSENPCSVTRPGTFGLD
jgi:hypothetical protein